MEGGAGRNCRSLTTILTTHAFATTLTHRRSSGRGGGSLRPRGAPDTAPTRPVRAKNGPHHGWGGGWSWNGRGRRISPHHLPSATTPRTTIRGVSIAVMQTLRACHNPAAPARARGLSAVTRL